MDKIPSAKINVKNIFNFAFISSLIPIIHYTKTLYHNLINSQTPNNKKNYLLGDITENFTICANRNFSFANRIINKGNNKAK